MTPTVDTRRRAVRVVTPRLLGTTTIALDCGHQLRITEAERMAAPLALTPEPGQLFDCPECALLDGEAIAAATPHTD